MVASFAHTPILRNDQGVYSLYYIVKNMFSE